MDGAVSRNDNNPKIAGSSGNVGTAGSLSSKKSQVNTVGMKKKINK
jgi:hypothetical protein